MTFEPPTGFEPHTGKSPLTGPWEPIDCKTDGANLRAPLRASRQKTLAFIEANAIADGAIIARGKSTFRTPVARFATENIRPKVRRRTARISEGS